MRVNVSPSFIRLNQANLWKSSHFLPGGAATCSEGFVINFLRDPQAVGLYCSCHAAQASKRNSKKTYYKTFGTSGRPTQYERVPLSQIAN